MRTVKVKAQEKGIFLKGDIPILVSPDSADVWEFQAEFDLTLFAGAPPDAYSPKGQCWGLPLFRWDVMEKKGFDFWKRRLLYASSFYDLYRIDHVLGFYRIWAIPRSYPASKGHFVPEDRAGWIAHGEKLLSTLIDFTPMLPIAEDLGTVPPSVRSNLSTLGICGTRVMRWEKDGVRFIDPLEYDRLSMTTVSTHDSPTLGTWWEEEADQSRAYAKQKGLDWQSHLNQQLRKAILFESHHTQSLFHINLLGEYLALFPELSYQDQKKERINVPGTVCPTNWTYRTYPFIEDIVNHLPLKNMIEEIIQ